MLSEGKPSRRDHLWYKEFVADDILERVIIEWIMKRSRKMCAKTDNRWLEERGIMIKTFRSVWLQTHFNFSALSLSPLCLFPFFSFAAFSQGRLLHAFSGRGSALVGPSPVGDTLLALQLAHRSLQLDRHQCRYLGLEALEVVPARPRSSALRETRTKLRFPHRVP